MIEERGQVNAHTHLYSGLAPLGIPAPDPSPQTFVEILERLWWRLDRALDERSLRAAARLYVHDALCAGTTTLVDHHESPNCIEGSLDLLADVCQQLGVRALLCYGATERNRGRPEAEEGLRECRRFLRENDRPLVKGAVGLHASFTVSDDTLREAAEICRETGAVTHVHLAEDLADVEDAQRRGWASPLERLLSFDALPEGSILAHGVCLDRSAVQECARRGLWLVQNPRSNANNGVGHPLHLSATDRVALGTDGFPSVMREEYEFLRNLPLPPGESQEHRRARWEGGQRLVAERFGPRPSHEDYARFDGERCREVVVAGRRVVEDGCLRSEDGEGIVAEAQEAAARLWQRMEQLEERDS